MKKDNILEFFKTQEKKALEMVNKSKYGSEEWYNYINALSTIIRNENSYYVNKNKIFNENRTIIREDLKIVVPAIIGILQVLMVINAENLGCITTKALSFVVKPKV